MLPICSSNGNRKFLQHKTLGFVAEYASDSVLRNHRKVYFWAETYTIYCLIAFVTKWIIFRSKGVVKLHMIRFVFYGVLTSYAYDL